VSSDKIATAAKLRKQMMRKVVIPDPQDLPRVVGVDLGGTQLRVAVLRGRELLSRVSEPTGENPTPDRIIPRIYNAIEQALDESNTQLHQLAGLGIGVAGPLDSCNGIVFASPNLPGWDDVRLKAILEEYYKLPVFIENDANAAALGEFMFGAGHGRRDVVYLTMSTGIGGGIIMGGQLMTGTKGAAGELGHMTVDWHGEQCNCGNIGCLESIASGTAIARRASRAAALGINFFVSAEDKPAGSSPENSYIDAKVVARAAKEGVPEACSIIRDAAEALGIGLVNIIHVFNPDMIILGGGLTQIEESLLIEPAKQIVRARAMKAQREAVRIVLADLGAEGGLIGAGALIYSRSVHHRREQIRTPAAAMQGV
jgi:glucokinase